jgi:hypothetical protein
MKTLPPLSPTNLSSLFARPDKQTRAIQGGQLHQIADGVRNGSITGNEAAGLLMEQGKIASAQRAAMADGKLSLGERINLLTLQAKAAGNINSAKGNFEMDFFAPLDGQAQRQASQIDQIANGRTNNTITNSEAGYLLMQQAHIGATRDSGNPWIEQHSEVVQNMAETDIARHSKPGTQFPPFRAGAASVGGLIQG